MQEINGWKDNEAEALCVRHNDEQYICIQKVTKGEGEGEGKIIPVLN